MAYNPYPYGNQYSPYLTPNTQNTYAYVNGLEGAKAYQVFANQTVLLIDSENPVIYMKSANNFGQACIQCYKITQIQETDIKPKVIPEEYVSKADYDAVLKRIEVLENESTTKSN